MQITDACYLGLLLGPFFHHFRPSKTSFIRRFIKDLKDSIRNLAIHISKLKHILDYRSSIRAHLIVKIQVVIN